MGLWDERFSRCYSIVWLWELVLGLLEVLTTSKHGCTIPTLVDMGNSGLRAYVTNAHHCLLEAVEKLMVDLNQDPAKIERKSRGFLGIS